MAASSKGDPEQAREQIRQTTDAVLALFKERELFKPANTDLLLERFHAVLDERFDWVAMAEWVLGRKRSLFDQAQTDAFADAFSRYVVLHYLTQVEQHVLTDDPADIDKIRAEYREERTRGDGAVALEVAFLTPNGTRVVTGYTLAYDEAIDSWRVRNFIVEGVSLVRNWRSELASVPTREKIMDVMNAKVKSLRDGRQEAKEEK